MIVKNLAALAEFSSQKMAKTNIARGETLFAGLNCFEPGRNTQRTPMPARTSFTLY
jgi:hypothetical protein